MRIHSGRQCGKPFSEQQGREGTEGCHVEMRPLSDYVSFTKKNNQWKIQYGQKYFKTTNILEDFHLRVCQMRKNFIYLLLTRSGPYPRMPLFTAGREAGRATFGVDAF